MLDLILLFNLAFIPPSVITSQIFKLFQRCYILMCFRFAFAFVFFSFDAHSIFHYKSLHHAHLELFTINIKSFLSARYCIITFHYIPIDFFLFLHDIINVCGQM